MFEDSNMPVLIEMPLTIYQAFLGRCILGSRESERLRNSVLSHAPIYVRFGNVVECRCELEDAELLLTRAKLSYPLATSYIEEGMRLAKQTSDTSQIEYRRSPREIFCIFVLIVPNGPPISLCRLKTFPTIPRFVMNAFSKAGQ
jgi:hypothetical protein